MEKLVCFTLAILLMFSLSITAFANENDVGIADRENYHVSTVNPLDRITTYGTSSPTVAWNVVTQGPYDFRGNAEYSRLYLSYLLYGTTLFKAVVNNLSASRKLIVNPHDSTDQRSFEVAPSSYAIRKYVLEEGKTYFMLSFEAPSHFKGTVSEWIYQ